MNIQERAKKMLPFVQAMAEGKKIQFRRLHSGDKAKWEDTPNPVFEFTTYNYRVKPEPRVLWGIANRSGALAHAPWQDEQTARETLAYYDRKGCAGPYTLIKFVEQIDD